jgi:hypothetical protein
MGGDKREPATVEPSGRPPPDPIAWAEKEPAYEDPAKKEGPLVARAPRQRLVILVDQIPEARGNLVGPGHEHPVLPFSLQLSPQTELQLLESLYNLRLEPIQFGQIQIHVFLVQLPQGRDDLSELLLIEVFLREKAL